VHDHLLSSRWEQVKRRILDRWGDLLQDKNLPQDANFEDLCNLISRSCGIPIKTTRQEISDVLAEIANGPLQG
jgi:hypothetical protein